MTNSHLDPKTQKCWDFMQSIFKQEQSVTAISSLPYPKEIISQELLKLAKDDSNESVENKTRVRAYYLMLSTCIPDADATHVENMEKFLEKVKFPMTEDDKKKFISKETPASDIDRYMKIMADISAERNILIAEIEKALK